MNHIQGPCRCARAAERCGVGPQDFSALSQTAMKSFGFVFHSFSIAGRHFGAILIVDIDIDIDIDIDFADPDASAPCNAECPRIGKILPFR